MRNRVFFPQAALDQWLADDRVDLKNDELSIKGEARRFRIIEAVRVLREVTGSDDPHELLGRVKSYAFLNELGAELMERSMIIGENAYDVIPGFVGAPTSTFDEHRKHAPDGTSANDEALLLALIAQKSA
jgi:hypothetical protein